MNYEKLIEAYIQNLNAPDERERSDRTDTKYKALPQTRDARPWKNFIPKSTNGTFKDLTNFDQNKIWVWSDLHFFHNNIIRYCNRPFSSTDHMNNCLLENFCNTVGPNDISIWVGDVTFERHGIAITNNMLQSLPGYKILVFGNHDLEKGKLKDLYFDEIHAAYQLGNLIFTHYPWNVYVPDGYYSIHGHTHDKGTLHPKHINVSVEQVNYKPKSLASIIADRGLNYIG